MNIGHINNIQENRIINKNFYLENSINLEGEKEKNIYKYFIEIKRSIKDDLFFIKIRIVSLLDNKWNIELQMNNKKIEQSFNLNLPSQEYKDIIFPFILFEKEKFSTLNSLVFVLTLSNDQFSTKTIHKIKINSTSSNKNDYFIEDEKIHFKTLKALRTSNINPSKYSIKEYDKSIYNNIIIYPQKMELGKHNEILYKIVSYNDFFNDELIQRDFLINPKFLSNLPIENNENLTLKFIKSEKEEFINNKPVIGYIVVNDETYYDFEKQKTIKGVSSLSKKGYFIPYNFVGILKPKMSITLNNDFNDIQIYNEQKIDKKFLDPNDGIVRFTIKSYEENILTNNWYIILNSNFRFLNNENLTLEGLKQLHKKEEDEDAET